MSFGTKSILDRRKKYLQVALNGTMDDAMSIIFELPVSDRIILEAGTPFIKQYGVTGIRDVYNAYKERMFGNDVKLNPYVVADLKTMDRGATEVAMAADAGASAIVALGSAPVETLNSVISECEKRGLDAMIDMMNVEYPLAILHTLKKKPPVVILHRGVDEEQFNREKQIPYHEIQRIKGTYDMMISIAGGDTVREVQRSLFNGADIAVIWKSVYQNTDQTIGIVEEFLKEIR